MTFECDGPALDAQGKEVKLKVDPVSGKVNVK